MKKDLEELVSEDTYGKKIETMEEALREDADQTENADGEQPDAEAGKSPEGAAAADAGPETVPAEPELPAESMEDYKDELEASFRQIHVGDVMSGTVISVDETGVLLDLDYYAPGRVPVEEMSADPHFDLMGSVHVGDRFEATVTKRDDGKGNIVLSRKQADKELSWDKLRKMQEEKTVITGKIGETVRGGAILYVEGIRGFIPASRLALNYVEHPEDYLHREVSVQVIEVDEAAGRVILSAKELLAAQAIEEKNKRISLLAAGNIVEGTVESLKDYGAFVNIGDGITGLLHISQIQGNGKKIKHPKVVLSEGQKVRVLITKVDNGKVSLSMKALEDALNREAVEEEEEYHDAGQATTSLGDLLKGFKF